MAAALFFSSANIALGRGEGFHGGGFHGGGFHVGFAGQGFRGRSGGWSGGGGYGYGAYYLPGYYPGFNYDPCDQQVWVQTPDGQQLVWVNTCAYPY